MLSNSTNITKANGKGVLIISAILISAINNAALTLKVDNFSVKPFGRFYRILLIYNIRI
jgi:hypothetical protein